MKKFTNKVFESNISKISNIIDYTFFKKDASIDEIKSACNTAIENNFYSICVFPDKLSIATAFLNNTNVKLITIVSYPNGDKKFKDTIKEVSECITSGADEIDLVFNYKKIKTLTNKEDENYKSIYEELLGEITQITNMCHRNGVILKVIAETGTITYDQLEITCDICTISNVDYIMTSTGSLKNEEPLDKKLEKVKFMRNTLPDNIKIKVSGGIYSTDDAMKFINYVDRIGTSKIFIHY